MLSSSVSYYLYIHIWKIVDTLNHFLCTTSNISTKMCITTMKSIVISIQHECFFFCEQNMRFLFHFVRKAQCVVKDKKSLFELNRWSNDINSHVLFLSKRIDYYQVIIRYLIIIFSIWNSVFFPFCVIHPEYDRTNVYKTKWRRNGWSFLL